MENKLFLIDAYALIFRAYYAFIKNPRINSKGQNTSAIYGFINTIDEVLKKENPSHIAVCFDPPGGSFRREMFSEYKANRDSTPEDIILSVPYIKQYLECLNIPIIEVPGYEADDVVGTIAHKVATDSLPVYMMTPDKDYMQLVTDNIFMFKPRKGLNDPEVLDVKKVCEHFSVSSPMQVIDILGLWGDSADNVPGAPGIGEKGSKEIIAKYHSIEGIYENIDDFKGKRKENLINFREQIELSKQLVTIELEVPVEIDLDSYKRQDANTDQLFTLYKELEFRNLESRHSTNASSTSPQSTDNTIVASKPKTKPVNSLQYSLFDPPPATPVPQVSEEEPVTNAFKTISDIFSEYRLVDTDEQIDDLISYLQKQPSFCFDTETTGLDPHISDLLGVAFCAENNKAFYLSIPENYDAAVKVLSKFEFLFNSQDILKIAQNLKFDMKVLRKYDLSVTGPIFDTMIAHYLLYPSGRHNMDAMSEQYLNYKPIKIEELIGKGKNQLTLKQISIDKVVDYACEDADVTWQLYKMLQPEIEKDSGVFELYNSIELPLIHVLADMEWEGVNLNTDSLQKYSVVLNEQLQAVEQKIYDLSESTFNIASPKQLGDVLFDKMQLDPKAKRSKSGQFSTGEEVLVKLKDKHEIIQVILDYRSLKKLLNTYVEALPKLVTSTTNRVHTSYNQAVAATGRLSSTNPNLQNIPVRDANGREVRKAFVPRGEDFVFLSADYSQVELRLMAHLSQDENMIEAFNSGEDIHAATAIKIFGEATKENRSKAKTANFGIIYGISAFGLAQRLNIPRTEAKQLIDGYFESYPMVKVFMDKAIADARQNEYVETLFNRKRYLKDINSQNGIVRGNAERNAINAPIQGTAADIIKIAMISIHEKITSLNLKTKMILQVHDELIFDVYKPELEIVKEIVREGMESASSLSVPLIVDMGTGDNWLDAH